MLDVGRATAQPRAQLARTAEPSHCIDLNARAIEAVQERIAKTAPNPRRVADVHQLPFPDASFDDVPRLSHAHLRRAPRARDR